MNGELLTSIAVFIFSVAFLLAMIFIFGVLITVFVCSYLYAKEYKKAVINILECGNGKKDSELYNSIEAEYVRYRNRRINASSYMEACVINSQLISELNSDKYKKYHEDLKGKRNDVVLRLERINNLIKERTLFQEEKLSELLNEIKKCPYEDKARETIAEKTNTLFQTCIFWCNGRLFEKDIVIENLKYDIRKMKTSKIISNVVAVVGLVSGIITILMWIQSII